MGLLARSRRRWIGILLGLLWLPLLGQLFLPSRSLSQSEARSLTPLPALPTSFNELTRFPTQLNRYLSDHFGFRDRLISANSWIRYALVSPTNPYVLYGKDGYFFYVEHGTLEQSVGLVVRKKPLEKLAEALSQLHAELSKRKIQFLFTVPPNNSTINNDHLPDWLPRSPALTEYDVMLRLLAARGVPTLDLRPALRAENAVRATYYRTDTHWNLLGALVAHNEIVRAVGHPEWAMDVGRVFRGMRRTYGERDLPRMLGIRNAPEDQDAVVDVSSYPDTGGPTVLIVGDSFTTLLFPVIWRNGGRPVYMERTGCRLDVAALEAHRPSIVIVAMVERSLPLACAD
jgi:hypothetical protein